MIIYDTECPVKFWKGPHAVLAQIQLDTSQLYMDHVCTHMPHLDLVDFDQKVFATARTQYVQ